MVLKRGFCLVSALLLSAPVAAMQSPAQPPPKVERAPPPVLSVAQASHAAPSSPQAGVGATDPSGGQSAVAAPRLGDDDETNLPGSHATPSVPNVSATTHAPPAVPNLSAITHAAPSMPSMTASPPAPAAMGASHAAPTGPTRGDGQ